MRLSRWLIMALLLTAACEDRAPVREPVPPAAEPAPTTPPAGAPLVQLIAPAEGDTLRFRLSAPADQTLYLDHCNGAFAWGLERRVAASWTQGWVAVINQCHSAPIEIPPGGSRVLEGIINLQPGEHIEPDTYRVAIYGLFTAHDQESHLANPEVPAELRVSEPFAFGRPAAR